MSLQPRELIFRKAVPCNNRRVPQVPCRVFCGANLGSRDLQLGNRLRFVPPDESKPLASALLYCGGQVAHGLLGSDAAFTAGKGSFGFIDCGNNLGASMLAFFPLIGSEAQFHALRGMEKLRRRQVPDWPPALLSPSDLLSAIIDRWSRFPARCSASWRRR